MKETALQLLRDQDTFAVIDYVARQGDPLVVVAAFDELMRELYWQQKNLAASLALGCAGAQHAITSAGRLMAEHPEMAEQLRGKAKAFCYNLASFAWSGWGEEGIAVSPSVEALGLDAARANLRLGKELSRGDLAMSRAHWMLGAQQISARDYGAAIESFGSAERHATAAGEKGDELLAIAFARLAQFLADRTNDAVFQALAEAVGVLAKAKDGAMFAGQVTKALEVFFPACERLGELKSVMTK